MHVKCLGRIAIILSLSLTIVVSARAAEEGEKPPYEIINGKVDFGTYNGYRRYHNSCHRCHGPDAIGSSFAPSLMESLRDIDQDQFNNIVVNGRIDGKIGFSDSDSKTVASTSGAGEVSAMPAFGMDPNVMDYLDNIYAYIKARSDGALGPGRPKRLPKKKSN